MSETEYEFQDFVEALEYEWEKLIGEKMFSSTFWRMAEAPTIVASIMESWLCDDASVVVRWQVAKRRMLSYRWPANWKEAFKERWFPAWAKKRWSVRYKTVALDELLATRKDSERFTLPVRYFIDERMGS